jgi:Glycosyltransferase family 87
MGLPANKAEPVPRLKATHASVDVAWHPRPLVYAPLILFAAGWLLLLLAAIRVAGGPNPRSFGGDFAMFYSASHVVAHGGNPYDQGELHRGEVSAFRSTGDASVPQRRYVRVGIAPLALYALYPLARLPFSSAALIWMSTMYVLCALGFLAILRFARWRNRLWPTVFFLATPQVVSGIYYGNVDGLVFAGIGGALVTLDEVPLLAGSLLVVAWLKPPVALPIVMLILLIHAARPRLVALGFVGMTLLLTTVTVFATGMRSLEWWLIALTTYSHQVSTLADVAPITGLYDGWADVRLTSAMQLATLLIACALTYWSWRHLRSSRPVPLVSAAWLWLVWFLAAPFGHLHDEILLTLPILVLMGAESSEVPDPWRAVCLYLVVMSVLLLYWTPMKAQLLALPLIAVALALYRLFWRFQKGTCDHLDGARAASHTGLDL